jgi:hypothetical protein
MGRFDGYLDGLAEADQTEKQAKADQGFAVDLNPPSEATPPLDPQTGSAIHAAPPPASKFDSFIGGLADQEDQRVNRALNASAIYAPDTYARAKQIAGQFNVPIETAVSSLGDLEHRRQMEAVKSELEKSPQLSEWLKEGDNANHVDLGDIERVSGLEWLLKSGRASWTSGMDQQRLAYLRYEQMNGRATPAMIAEADGISSQNAERLGEDSWMQSAWTTTVSMLPYMAQTAGQSFKSSVQFGTAGAAAGAISGSAAGGIGAIPGAAAGYAFASTAGLAYGAFMSTMAAESGLAFDEYSKIRDENGKPLDPDLIRFAALGAGSVNGALEVVGLERLAKFIPGVSSAESFLTRGAMREALKNPTVRGALTKFAKDYLATGATEVGVEAAQELSTIVGGEAAKSLSGQDVQHVSIGDATKRIADTAIATAQAMSLMGMLGVGRLPREIGEARKAQAQAPVLAGIADAMKSTPVRDRAPEKTRDMVDRQAEGSDLTEVYVPAERAKEFFQSIEPADRMRIERAVPDLQQRFTEAVATGGDIRLSTGEWAAGFAGTAAGDALTPHVRFDAQGMSEAEATEFNDKTSAIREETIAQDLERQRQEREARAPVETIYDDVRERAMVAGITGERADKIANLISSFFAARQSREPNTDVLSLYQSYGLDIRRALPESLQFVPTDSQGLLIDAIRSGRSDAIKAAAAAKRSTLVDFIVNRGGVVDSGGELKNIGAEGIRKGLVRSSEEATPDMLVGAGLGRNEYGLDATARAAWEAGYFPELGERPTPDDLVHALAEHIAGRPRLAEERGAPSTVEQWTAAADDLRDYMHRMGIDYENLTNAEVKAALAKTAAGNIDGLELFQGEPGDGKRGSIQFGDRQTVINLFQGENLSTMLHETGHLFLQIFHDVAVKDGASDQAKSDWAELKTWLGLEGDEITTEAHEKFAKGFEAYLFDGRAPSEDLRSAFEAFRSWLVFVYRKIQNLGEPVPKNIRDVMDRLLATDEQIETVSDNDAFRPALKDAGTAGLTPEEYAQYSKTATDLVDEARNEVDRRLLAQVKRTTQQEWREAKAQTKAAVAAEFDDMPVYQAFQFLRDGRLVGSASTRFDEAPEPMKLDRDELERAYGPTVFGKLPRSVPPIYAKNGASMDQVASMFGFAHGHDLVDNLLSAPAYGRALAAEVDTRMRDRFGDLMSNQAALANETVKAFHSDGRALFLQTELKALTAKGKRVMFGGRSWTVGGLTPRELALRLARSTFNAKTVRDAVRIGSYVAAERKNGRDAERAILAGKWDEAAEWKRRQLLAHEMAMQSKSVSDEVERIQSKLSRYEGSKIPAGVDPSYVDQIKALLERFEFRKVSLSALDRRKSLRDFIADREAAGEVVPDLPDGLLNEAYRNNYRDMTVEALRGLSESVTQLEHLGRMKYRLFAERNAKLREAVVTDVLQSIADNNKKKRKIDIETRLPGTELGRTVNGFFAAHRKMASIARQLDGFKDAGAVWDALVRPLNKAGDTEASMTEKAATALHDIFRVYSIAEVAKLRQKELIPEIGMGLSKYGQLAVALNWGNMDNRLKLKDAYKWNDGQVQAVLDKLDERDWRVVQGVLDHINSYWPEIVAKQKRVYGFAPTKVEATPIQTRFGSVPGGYYPLKYDDRQSPRAFKDRATEAAEAAIKGVAARASTARGHTKERVGSAGLPVRLDIDGAFEHVGQVIHDLSHHEALIDINRILGDSRVQQALYSVGGQDLYNIFLGGVKDVAAGHIASSGFLETAFNWLRSGASIAGMGWSLTTALQQPLGITQSIVRVGPKWIGVGVSRMFRDAASMEMSASWVNDKSDFMRLRAKTQLREINDIRNRVGKTYGGMTEPVKDSYFWLITRMQLLVDVPTWIGQYEKSMASGLAEEKAIALADQAVIDSQGGGQMKDLAQVQRGGALQKLWTNFYSYFSTLYNLTAEVTKQTDFRSPKSIGLMAVNMLLLYSVPVVGAIAMKSAIAAIGGGDDDKDNSNVAVKLARAHLAYLAGTMVGIREVSSAIQGFYGYSGPAGGRFFADVASAGRQISQGQVDGDLLKALNSVGGSLFHYPALQVQRTVDGVAAIAEGRTKSPAALMFGGPKEPKR